MAWLWDDRGDQVEKAAMWIGEKRSGEGDHRFRSKEAHRRRSLRWPQLQYLAYKRKLPGVHDRQASGVFPDIRFKPGKAYGASYDAGGITHTSTEMLLKIIGSDTLTLGRKYLGAWHGQLRLKLTLISNVVLNFTTPRCRGGSSSSTSHKASLAKRMLISVIS